MPINLALSSHFSADSPTRTAWRALPSQLHHGGLRRTGSPAPPSSGKARMRSAAPRWAGCAHAPAGGALRVRGGVPAQLEVYGGAQTHARWRRCQFRLFVREVDPGPPPSPPPPPSRRAPAAPGHGPGLRSPLQAAYHRR